MDILTFGDLLNIGLASDHASFLALRDTAKEKSEYDKVLASNEYAIAKLKEMLYTDYSKPFDYGVILSLIYGKKELIKVALEHDNAELLEFLHIHDVNVREFTNVNQNALSNMLSGIENNIGNITAEDHQALGPVEMGDSNPSELNIFSAFSIFKKIFSNPGLGEIINKENFVIAYGLTMEPKAINCVNWIMNEMMREKEPVKADDIPTMFGSLLKQYDMNTDKLSEKEVNALFKHHPSFKDIEPIKYDYTNIFRLVRIGDKFSISITPK